MDYPDTMPSLFSRRSVMQTIGGTALLVLAFPSAARLRLSRDVFAVELPSALRRGFEVARDGERIEWTRYGHGPEMLIFIHGWMCDRSDWYPQARAFADRYQVVLIDLPGHGDSSFGRKEWTMSTYADDVARVANRLSHHRPVHLVGHSMGGVVAALAAAATHNLASVSAVDIFTTPHPPVTPAPSSATGTAYVLEARAAIRRRMFGPGMSTEDAERIATAMANGPQDIGRALIADMQRQVGAPSLAALPVSVPLHLINSARHPVDLDALRTFHAKTDATIIAEVGHFIMLERPETFNAALSQAIGA